MNLDYVCNEIARMRVEIVTRKTRSRCLNVLASARHQRELLLVRMRAKLDDLCNRRAKSHEPPLRGNQVNRRAGDRGLTVGLSA
jgi:hypothetical protein